MTEREIEAMRKEVEAANAHRRDGLKRLYLCDPRKNRWIFDFWKNRGQNEMLYVIY